MKTYDIYYDVTGGVGWFRVGGRWNRDLSKGDINQLSEPTTQSSAIKLTLPITCRTNEDFYKLYPEYLI